MFKKNIILLFDKLDLCVSTKQSFYNYNYCVFASIVFKIVIRKLKSIMLDS